MEICVYTIQSVKAWTKYWNKYRLKFAYDIAKGLNHLNSVKVHMSENIVITGSDVAKITNFSVTTENLLGTGKVRINSDIIPNVKFTVLVFFFGRLDSIRAI